MENLYIAIDSNSKLGKEFIPQDPKEQSKNGMLLGDIIKKTFYQQEMPFHNAREESPEEKKTINTID